MNIDPVDPTKYCEAPAWWTESSGQLFVNLLEDCFLKIQVGDGVIDVLTYKHVSSLLELKVDEN